MPIKVSTYMDIYIMEMQQSVRSADESFRLCMFQTFWKQKYFNLIIKPPLKPEKEPNV